MGASTAAQVGFLASQSPQSAEQLRLKNLTVSRVLPQIRRGEQKKIASLGVMDDRYARIRRKSIWRNLVNYPARTIVLLWLLASATFALSQASPCANPNAPRVGLIAMHNRAFLADSPSSFIALTKRLTVAETKFINQLAQRLPPDSCIVRDGEIFSDPKNFPQLKGSLTFEISAAPSPRNPNVYALAISISVVEGIYAENQFHVLTQPILIETEADYASGAQTVMQAYQISADVLTDHKPQK
jgi:hypothetical protein